MEARDSVSSSSVKGFDGTAGTKLNLTRASDSRESCADRGASRKGMIYQIDAC